ncbi:aspartate ammonia-lyase [Alkalihalobacillus alcalophilus ATCC 27647 = CGMCC 1.3604]|uniref:Aspartate ammonia-lyase n=1 Tax=Alkalihalobacillus alcalophilus ATCC 27647 = CGMCC 1.3604 TaxID=1218173 RepID=A0A094WLM2_ALKAL|nr:aspartate ammonia-lyase [Alkalihalobacillus alcalophilus]KGA96833.1 aspartate ammonia-lyase [Alkalihalobacillus alcalophilus ATCC 27647 = CGMCC 1.3604]MED1561222.1 aspartate ammonia-lyase [Alkalihalobacillus alcalophilus]THG88849.1 aspartate ammonia-lyase [Alkalihalobacillus alcalophilus ATCC 27647 = CGMCC 1.3604]
MTEYRIERDLLGEKEVPKDAYYGIQTMRARDNFPITGYPPHEELIKAFGYVKKAAAMANRDVGVLQKKIAGAVILAAEEVIEGKLSEHFIVDSIQGGAGTSFNMNANEVIANRAIEELGGKKGEYMKVSPNTHVNMAQSTNDAFPTAIHIACLNLSKGLIQTLNELIEAVKKKEEEFDDVLKMGRTHLQDAVPIRLGQEFGAYRRVLTRDLKRIERSVGHLYDINMGATAVGTGLNAKPEYIEKVSKYLAEITGFPLKTAEDLVDATQNTDAYTELSSALKIMAINLSKIANDLRLMSSGPRTGLNEINLPARQPGSSIMPGKVNPVMCEVINQISFQVIGNDHTISLASEAGQLELNVMEPVLVFNLLQSFTILQNGMDVFRKFAIDGITANIEHCREMVEHSVGIITAINPHVGYEVASRVAKEAIETGRSVREICLERGILSEEELNEILDPKEMTNPGIAGARFIYG